MSKVWLLHLLGIILILSTCEAQGRGNQPPEFLPGGNMMGFSIREDTPVGTSVYRLRGYDPEETDMSYSVSGDFLSVNQATGEVTLVKALDRETKATIDVIITVADGRVFGEGPNIIPVQVSIPVIDVNDNSPKFLRGPYKFSVKESTSKGATLFSDIQVTDEDAGDNARITLSCIVEETPESCRMFEVREAPGNDGDYVGIISLREQLDYETHQSYKLALRAEDNGLPRGQSSTTTLVIDVIDVQDQPPIFLNAPYSATVKEASPQGTNVLTIKVRDGDLGNPRDLSLSLYADDLGYFTLSKGEIQEDGTVFATLATSGTPIDREDKLISDNGGIYTFNIKAKEWGSDGQSMTEQVTIVITDIDDKKPTFNKNEVHVLVSEDLANGTPIPGLDLIVSDEDIGANAKFSLALEDLPEYSNVATGTFSVFPKTAVGRTPVIIKIADSSQLDFETESGSSFVFKVIASHGDLVSSAAIVNVTVTDANDNSPVFEQHAYRYSVSESADPGTYIATLLATDLDSGDYGKMTYDIKGFGAEKFNVDPNSGTITVNKCSGVDHCLDYERQTTYSLTYSATDGGNIVTSVNVFIDVIDENDNSPVFVQREYRRTVDEGADSFDPPLIVKATDVDGGQGEGEIFYTLVDGNTEDSAFSLDPATGELSIKRPLTHIDVPSLFYALTIRATDVGLPPRSTDVRVYVTVGRDTNRPPRFPKWTYEGKVDEDSPKGTFVLQVVATDPDGEDALLEYQLVSGARDSFIIDSKTGAISVSDGALLDRDVMDTFRLNVVAVDDGGETRQSSTATVLVNLRDVNNKPPKFSQDTYVRYISERVPVGEVIMTVSATDPDLDSELNYFIKDPIIARDKTGVSLQPDSAFNYREAFSINETSGEISVARRLNHNEAAVIILSIDAVDINANNSDQRDSTEVNFYIQAYSDKIPIFDPPWTPKNPVLNIELKEEQELGKPLFSVAAKDAVTGQAVRNYEKVHESDPDNIFDVDPITGKVALNSRLDYESSSTKKAGFQVLAVAGDRSSQATVTVNIIDINDNSPQFVQSQYQDRLPEDTVWPKTVLVVSATDNDTREYGDIRYEIGGEGALQFVINDTTGEIRVARGARLDREKTPVITLEVTASDMRGEGGVNQRKTTILVTLDLTDVNDEKPIWPDGGRYTAVVAENTEVGVSVIHLIASDPDRGINGVVRYYLPEPQGEINRLFEIDRESGILSVKSRLSGKGRTEPYEVRVRAVDQGTPQQFSEAVVTLFIGDVSTNDGVPTFVSPSANQGASVAENSKAKTAVFQVKAVDPDDPNTPNGKIVYSFLDDGGEDSAFSIDPSSGLIKTKAVLDRESKDQYTVVILAQDLGIPPQITSRLLYINVTDTDDNTPIFIKNTGGETLELEVEEEAAVDTIVGYVSAVDRDIGNNALIDYTILDGYRMLFGVNRTLDNRGMIYVKSRVDREEIDSVELVIMCGKYGERLTNRRKVDLSDPSQVKVKILIRDLDDNRPFFPNQSLTSGVRVDAPLQTEVLRLKAVDKDPTSLPIKYSLHNITISHVENSGELVPINSINASEVFLLNENTGVIKTNAPLNRFAHGIFTAYISASSSDVERPVFAEVTIYVLRDTDLLRFVFGSTPGEVRHQLAAFSEKVEEAIKLDVKLNIYDTAYYTDNRGAIDFSSTGSCFQFVGRSMKDTEILLDTETNSKLDDLFKKYRVKKVERCVPRKESRTSADWVEIWVLILSALIGLGAATATISVCCLYSRYKRKLHKHQRHLRLLDSPQPPAMSGPPGSIIMLPPGPPPMGGSNHGIPHGPPMGPDGPRNYEWQERGMPLDNVSFRG